MNLPIPGIYAKKIGKYRVLVKRSPIIVRAAPRDQKRGILSFGPLRFPCALGRGGIKSLKREGDGATPLSRIDLVGGYFNKGRGSPYPSTLPFKAASAHMGWCDEPSDANYNRLVTLPYHASSEALVRKDRLYDTCIILDWNLRHRRRGAGSAIFLHIAKPGYSPTEGCIAVSTQVMRRLLPYLERGTPLIVMR